MTSPDSPQHLWSTYEIRTFLGVTRQRVQDLVTRPDFPTPYDTLSAGQIRVWRIGDIVAWAATWPRQTGRPRKTAPETAPVVDGEV